METALGKTGSWLGWDAAALACIGEVALVRTHLGVIHHKITHSDAKGHWQLNKVLLRQTPLVFLILKPPCHFTSEDASAARSTVIPSPTVFGSALVFLSTAAAKISFVVLCGSQLVTLVLYLTSCIVLHVLCLGVGSGCCCQKADDPASFDNGLCYHFCLESLKPQ